MYSLTDYGGMLAEPVRLRAYVDAMRAAIRPGCVVLEIGTGPGVFALLAARLGARKVFAIDPSDTVHIAREVVDANGLSERIELSQTLSTSLDLPERADVVVSDLRGVLPLFRDHVPSIVDARERLLAPGGRLIPQQDTLWASVVNAEDAYRELTCGWTDNGLGFDLSIPLGYVTNAWTKVRLRAKQCLVDPQPWAVLDYRTVESCHAIGHLSWQVTRPGLAHGLAIWFDTEMGSGTGFSNAPAGQELIYGQALFPFSHPIELCPADRMAVDLEARRVGDDYVWRWRTSIESTSGRRQRLVQSTFHGMPLSPSRLRRRSAGYMPELDDEGRIELFVLARMDGRSTLETIARELRLEFPSRFESWRDALTRVADLAQRHG